MLACFETTHDINLVVALHLWSGDVHTLTGILLSTLSGHWLNV